MPLVDLDQGATTNFPVAGYVVTKQIASVMALDNYPFSAGPLGSVDTVRLQRVVEVMQQFLKFDSAFSINSMLISG